MSGFDRYPPPEPALRPPMELTLTDCGLVLVGESLVHILIHQGCLSDTAEGEMTVSIHTRTSNLGEENVFPISRTQSPRG